MQSQPYPVPHPRDVAMVVNAGQARIIKGSRNGRNKRRERPKEKRHIFHIKKENTYGIRDSDSTDISQMIRNIMNIFEPGNLTIYKATLCKNTAESN